MDNAVVPFSGQKSGALSTLGGAGINAIADVVKTRLANPDPVSRNSSPRMNALIALNSPQTVIQPGSNRLSTSQKIGIGVGVGVAFAAGAVAGAMIKSSIDKEKAEAARRQELLSGMPFPSLRGLANPTCWRECKKRQSDASYMYSCRIY